MVAPVAVAAGRKAAGNPGASVFLTVLVGAVLVHGVRNLFDLELPSLPKIPGVDTVKAVYGDVVDTTKAVASAVKDSTLDTWEHQYEIVERIPEITPEQDPLEKLFFGDFSGSLGPDDEEQFGFWQTGYRGARDALFTGFSSPYAPR